MLPIYARNNAGFCTKDFDTVSRARRFLYRHTSNRTLVISIFTTILVVSLYLSWPFDLRESFQSFSNSVSPIRRTRYTEWPKDRRADAVREAFLHAYRAYEVYALPADEFAPLMNGTVQNFNGWGVSVFDALDTLWLMDLKPEFERAIQHVSQVRFQRHNDYNVMFFETVIRYLGGLLSAYGLSGRAILLHKANELAQKLLPVFNTTTGIPAYAVDVDTGDVDPGARWQNGVLAEIGTCQMEFKYLAHLTGDMNYFNLTDKLMDWFEKNQLPNGMWYTSWNIGTGEMTDRHLTIGAFADSAYEYLLKQYLLSDRTEARLRDMYVKSMNGVINDLLYLSPNRQILYATNIRVAWDGVGQQPSHVFEHLSCFLPGLLALGARTLADELDIEDHELHMWAAEGLAYSCWLLYADQPTGLGPEEALFKYTGSSQLQTGPHGNRKIPPVTQSTPSQVSERWVDAVERWKKSGSRGKPPGVPDARGGLIAQPMPEANEEHKDYHALKPKYLLRPETIESLYVLWRVTGDDNWQERAWQIFLAIEDACRQPVGYASVTGVDRHPPDTVIPLDEMPSYALAETWKYLYLTFLDFDPLPMDKFVFNTEAHPFPLFRWTDQQKTQLRIH